MPIGSTYTDVTVVCQTSGTVGNDFAVGDINTIVDVYDYYSGCSNVTASANGSDAPDDDEGSPPHGQGKDDVFRGQILLPGITPA